MNKYPEKLLLHSIILIFLTAMTFFINSSELYSIALESNRKLNPLLIEYFMEGNDQDKTEITRGLGERDDYYSGDFIVTVFPAFRQKETFKRDHFIRILISAQFHSDYGDEELVARMAENRTALIFLYRHMDNIGDYLLKGELFKLIALSPPGDYKVITMRELEKLIRHLRSYKKIDKYEVSEELEAILPVIKLSRDRAFIQPLVRLIQYSVDKRIVDKARDLIKYLKKANL